MRDSGRAAVQSVSFAQWQVGFAGRVEGWLKKQKRILKICDPADTAACTTPYHRILPYQKFGLHLSCPPGKACASATDNRVKSLRTCTARKALRPCARPSDPAQGLKALRKV